MTIPSKQQYKRVKRTVDGVLLLDKACGLSSNSALQQVRHLYQAKKAGHTGVLDPLATGLLPVCFGQATKFAQYLLDADKAYLATLKFGEATTTGDAEGEIIETAPADFSEKQFLEACTVLSGKITQLPPMYSALKYQGKPLYEYARKGIEIERKLREVTIYKIQLLSFELPVVEIAVTCSKGTYIRTLAEDLAKQLGSVAHLIGLRRTKTAGFGIEQSYDYLNLSDLNLTQLDEKLLPCDILVAHIPELILDEKQIIQLKHGQNVQINQKYGKMEKFRIYDVSREFIGLAQYSDEEYTLKALRLMDTSQEEV